MVAIRRGGDRGLVERLAPDPDLALETGELLVVAGKDDDLRRLVGGVMDRPSGPDWPTP